MFNVVSLEMLTAHSHSHPRQITIIIHNINRHSKWLSISRAGGGARQSPLSPSDFSTPRLEQRPPLLRLLSAPGPPCWALATCPS